MEPGQQVSGETIASHQPRNVPNAVVDAELIYINLREHRGLPLHPVERLHKMQLGDTTLHCDMVTLVVRGMCL
jgi:hypothetical protein